jgi:hypothetical protein
MTQIYDEIEKIEADGIIRNKNTITIARKPSILKFSCSDFDIFPIKAFKKLRETRKSSLTENKYFIHHSDILFSIIIFLLLNRSKKSLR